jgi:hypothetical protein
VPGDLLRTKWIDESTLLLDDLVGGWIIDVNIASSRRVPYPTSTVWTIDNGGVVVEGPDYEGVDVFTDWVSASPRRLDPAATGRLSRLVATSDTIVGTTYEHGPFRVVVVDRSDLKQLAALPLRDFEGAYGNGGLQPVAVRDDGTVLIWVTVLGAEFGLRLVAWDPGAGRLNLVTSVDAEPTDGITLAVDLLR